MLEALLSSFRNYRIDSNNLAAPNHTATGAELEFRILADTPVWARKEETQVSNNETGRLALYVGVMSVRLVKMLKNRIYHSRKYLEEYI